MPYKQHALFAISSLGLGHATRSLAVMRQLLSEGWFITIVSSGNALTFLNNELSGEAAVTFVELTDYPPLERGSGWRFYWYLAVDLLGTWRRIRSEQKELQKIESGFDFIFSDGRYGFYSEKIPSFILTHQVAFMPPPLLKKAFWITKHINLYGLRKFDTILIPDFPDTDNNLSGKLSHLTQLKRHSHSYVGILSSYRPMDNAPDIDYLFVISGYLFEHKEAFLRSLIDQAKKLSGRKVFILGQHNESGIPSHIKNFPDIDVYPMVDGDKRQELFNRSRVIVARAGYTTVMDLVEHNKRALLIPTPNQTEQEYLADFLDEHGRFPTVSQQDDIELQTALRKTAVVDPFKPPWRTGQSVKKLRSCIDRLIQKNFISIIVPAHNEEAELDHTLASLVNLDYPEDRFEIIVVENGSTDNTLFIANAYAADRSCRPVTVLQSGHGVSRAKNKGIANLSPKSQWVVFCDADTRLGRQFLKQLNTKLNREANRDIVVGTCSITPEHSDAIHDRMWFRFYDLIHSLTKSSYSLQIARTSAAREIGFRTDLELAEDLIFIKQCRKHGSFFFVSTDQVSTSTRRFDSVGYLRLSITWLIGALLPINMKQRWKYHVIR